MLIKKKDYPKINITETRIFEKTGVIISKEQNNTYGFDIYNKLFTNDVLEAVAYLIKFPNLKNEEFWNFEVNEKMLYNINPMNIIYWLSGGDEFWNNYNWSNYVDIYTEYWTEKIINLENIKTLNDIRQIMKKNFNLDEFYEFALNKNLI